MLLLFPNKLPPVVFPVFPELPVFPGLALLPNRLLVAVGLTGSLGGLLLPDSAGLFEVLAELFEKSPPVPPVFVVFPAVPAFVFPVGLALEVVFPAELFENRFCPAEEDPVLALFPKRLFPPVGFTGSFGGLLEEEGLFGVVVALLLLFPNRFPPAVPVFPVGFEEGGVGVFCCLEASVVVLFPKRLPVVDLTGSLGGLFVTVG